VGHGVKGVEIERVARGHHQPHFHVGNGNHLVTAGDIRRHDIDHLLRNSHLSEVHILHAGVRSQRAEHVGSGHNFPGNEGLYDALAWLGLRPSFVHLGSGDQTRV